MAIIGIPEPKQIPFAVDTPMRSPVYDPGPSLTATAERSLVVRLFFLRSSSMNTASCRACAWGSALSQMSMILESLERETEQTSVPVSMHSMMLMVSSVSWALKVALPARRYLNLDRYSNTLSAGTTSTLVPSLSLRDMALNGAITTSSFLVSPLRIWM